MTEQNVDLVKVFSQVARTLSKNKETLNQADTYNHDHGDHMADTFKTISNAMKVKKGSDASEMLNYAAQKLSQNANNGSAQLYSQGLQKAAQQFQGQDVDTKSALSLLQTILSAGGQSAPQQTAQPSSGMGDLLGSLLGGGQTSSSQSSGMEDLLGSLLGSGQSTPQQGTQQAAPGEDLLGSLLGGLTGSSQQQSAGGLSDGLDMGDLVTAGMAYFQAKQQGKTNMTSLIEAFVAASGMGSSAHRQQSTQLVASTFMNALGKMNK
ncbi:MAG: DAK2 domain-containing protein [Anaerolineaceae bacterium]|nr:DAK2 domain-containing protein [Anaerolineaceae bacterium]